MNACKRCSDADADTKAMADAAVEAMADTAAEPMANATGRADVEAMADAAQAKLEVIKLKLYDQRISKSAIYSRLPSSHSHDDQDGTFGVVKTSLKRFPMRTWDSFTDKSKLLLPRVF